MYQAPVPPYITPHIGRNALIYGLTAGLILGIVESGIVILFFRDSYHPESILSVPLSLLLWTSAFFVTGVQAGKHTGRVSAGTLAGLWAGMAGGTITAATMFVSLLSWTPYLYDALFGSVVADYLTMIIVLILCALGVGAGLGALGGLVGQSFSIPYLTTFQPLQSNNVPHQQEAVYAQPVEMEQYQSRRVKNTE